MEITIRPAVKCDVATILHFVTELAIYEKAQHQVLATEQKLIETIFSGNDRVAALICETQGQAIGIAIYFFNYSTWLAKPGLYLEDLYISPKFRGNGAGKKILQHLAQIAVAQGCGRFEWSCLDWNTPSREFYESIGAQAQPEWIGYRMSGQALTDFARKS